MKFTQSRLKELFNYDEQTGIFTRAKGVGGRAKGSVVGSRTRQGYITINVDYKPYLAHRLAWFYVHGKWPKDKIDHIDQVKDNNRISNLREASYTINNRNMPKRQDNRSGVTGVYKYPYTKWFAEIKVNKKKLHLGYFETKDEAIAARKHAEKIYHFHPNHGS